MCVPAFIDTEKKKRKKKQEKKNKKKKQRGIKPSWRRTQKLAADAATRAKAVIGNKTRLDSAGDYQIAIAQERS